MKKGSQAWYCYGNRTNESLMITYGFCLKDNVYDSVKCRFQLDVDTEGKDAPKLTDMIVDMDTESSQTL